MAMKPCDKCKCPTWKFKFDDATLKVTATCGLCRNKVTFLSKKGQKMKSGWIPPPLTKGVHAPDYEPIRHGPEEGAHGDDLVPPWVDYPERQKWLDENYPGEKI